jgi:hypothetical protein
MLLDILTKISLKSVARYEQYDVFMGVVGGAELCLSMR